MEVRRNGIGDLKKEVGQELQVVMHSIMGHHLLRDPIRKRDHWLRSYHPQEEL